MGLIARLFKNTGYLTIGNQIGYLLQFLFFLYFARQYGEKVVGQYSFAFSFTYILFLVIADLGMSTYLIREVSRDRTGNRKILSRCLGLRLLALIIVSLLVVLVVLIFFKDFEKETIQIIILLGLFHIIFSVADVFLAEFKGHDQMGLVALLSIFVKFVISGAGVLLIFLGFDFITVLTCFPIGGFVYLIVCMYFSLRYYKGIVPKFTQINLRPLVIDIIPFALAIIFVEVLYHQDILMLKALQDNQSVGIYSAANKIVLAFLGVLLFVHTALLPTFSRLYVDSRLKLIDVSKKVLRYLLLIGLPIATGLYAISDRLIVLLYKGGFRDSIIVLKILCWSIAFGFAAATYSILLTAINRQTQKVVVVGICLVFNFILNLVFIPKLSFNGAAMVKLMTEGLHFFLMAYLVSKYLTPLSVYKTLIKPAISCLFMYMFIYFFPHGNLIYLILISIFIYLFFLIVMRSYNEEELKVVKQFFSRLLLNNKFLKSHPSKEK